MAVNESESTNETKQIGKQKDGSVVASENDWCLSFVRNLPWGNIGCSVFNYWTKTFFALRF